MLAEAEKDVLRNVGGVVGAAHLAGHGGDGGVMVAIDVGELASVRESLAPIVPSIA